MNFRFNEMCKTRETKQAYKRSYSVTKYVVSEKKTLNSRLYTQETKCIITWQCEQ